MNSVVSRYLGLKPPMLDSSGALRGFKRYADGHGLDSEIVEVQKGNTIVGRAPVDEKVICWYMPVSWRPECKYIFRIKQVTFSESNKCKNLQYTSR